MIYELTLTRRRARNGRLMRALVGVSDQYCA